MMTRMRGWGLLLAVGVPLLIFFSWSQLGSEKARINLERFETWSAGNAATLAQPLAQYFLKNGKLAGPGDVALPAIPLKSGVKAWAVQADTTVLIELDAKLEGHAVQLKLVPVVTSATGIYYDCVTTTLDEHVKRVCQAEAVRAEAGIPAQLAANDEVLKALPAVTSSSGTTLQAGTAAGSVVVVPPSAADLNKCGFQCVKPQSCVTPRPLACGKTVDQGNSRWLEMAPTVEDFRGSSLATRSAADKACEQSLGAGYKVLNASGMDGVVKLSGDHEYWVHRTDREESNCWTTDYR